jgi:hypothetical protein
MGMGLPHVKQSTTKYHFPGIVNFDIAGPHCRCRMKQSSTANPGAAHHHNRADALRNDAERPLGPISSPSHLVRLIKVASQSGARELFMILDIDLRCVGQTLA